MKPSLSSDMIISDQTLIYLPHLARIFARSVYKFFFTISVISFAYFSKIFDSSLKNQVLVKPMGDFAHRIRVLGNQGTHSDISFAELGELRLFTQLFLQYTFTLPAMIPNVAQVTGVVG